MAREHILVVDDGADMRDFVIRYVLEPNGFHYQEAEDGLVAFERITASPPDLILLDLQMPRLDGIGLLRKMSEEKINIPVVLMTFYGSEEIAIEVFRLGVRDYVIKPFTDDELLEAIERALTVTRLRQERDTLTERMLTINKQLERRVNELETLFRISKIMISLTDEDELLVRLLESITYLTHIRDAELALLDSRGEVLTSRAVQTTKGIELVDQVVEHELAWRAVQEGVLVSGQPYTDPGNRQRMIPVCVPLVAGGVILGVLIVITPDEESLEHRISVLGALADYGAMGLERVRLLAAS